MGYATWVMADGRGFPRNSRGESIPSNLIAGMFGFKGREYFKAEEGATEVPKVEF